MSPPSQHRRFVLYVLCVLCVLCVPLLLLTSLTPAHAAPPEPMLALADDGTQDIRGWWLSEKLDGVRACWDGEQLWSKNGQLFAPPPDFIEELPPFPLEGELWGGRGTFEQTVSIVRQAQAHAGWRQLRFAVFDAPHHEGSFAARIAAAQAWFDAHPTPYAFVTTQTPLIDRAQLQAELQRVVAAGGEGLMVRDPQAPYRPGRSPTLLKVKAWLDAEARVVAHLPGTGRNAGRLGALLVERPDGVRFRIGSGFSDAERINPPPVGAVITYKYFGTHPSGLPKFPAYHRVRLDQDLTCAPAPDRL